MSRERKERQWQRYMRQMKHMRTREEEQRLDEARRARRHQRRPSREPADDEEFVKIRRQEPVLGRTARDVFVPNSAEAEATVTWLSRGRARVLTALGEREAVLSPDIASQQRTAIGVGDQVLLHERGDGEPVVAAVRERRSALMRVDPQNPNRRRLLAANVDFAVLVLTVEQPRTGLIDRLLVALHDSGAELLVCVNKCDLPHDEAASAAALAPYRERGLTVVVTSATRGDGVDDLRARLAGRCCAFVGHSGVGKSTLLNRLDPEADRSIGAVREKDHRGRHTTTASSLSVLADGTRLIDTPGVRAFGLWDGASDAAMAFPDILELAERCRFRDCAHVHEPGCAVRAAVDGGSLSAERYEAYRRIAEV